MRIDIQRELISRDDAHAQGLSYFYTGKQCKRGHVDLRFVSNGGCKSCVNRTKGRVAHGPNVITFPHAFSGVPDPEERVEILKILGGWSEAAFQAATKIVADRRAAGAALHSKLVADKEARDRGNG